MRAFSIADRMAQFLLPFAEREYIDMPRCCRILGVNETVARRLAETGLIDLIDHLPRTRKKVRYQSVVDYCDRLRSEYNITDRRPPLVQPYRHRDADLLPFPLSDTIDSAYAMEVIGCGVYTLGRLIDEGKVQAYRLVPRGTTPWRISRSSVAEHMQRVLQGVAGGPNAYVQNNVNDAGSPASPDANSGGQTQSFPQAFPQRRDRR